MNRPIITLTTDFGTRDPYVGAMKGAILAICPEAALVDITHEIASQDVVEGALALRAACSYYPAGSIHVAVIDPGVGSRRRALVLRSGEYMYVGPDNGLFSLVSREEDAAWSITNRAYMADRISTTFHGRDLFAPAAAHLALGLRPERLGRRTRRIRRLDLPRPRVGKQGVQGEVLHVDRFGNLISNIGADLLERTGSSEHPVVLIGDCEIGGIRQTYAEVRKGAPIALIGSTGLLEISVREGSAEEMLDRGKGTQVEVLFQK